MLLYLIKPFHLQAEADSQDNSLSPLHSHPEERMVNAWVILETQEKLLSEIILLEWWHEWHFFPDQGWVAVAGWHCFSLRNATVHHRSHSVSCVSETPAKG